MVLRLKGIVRGRKETQDIMLYMGMLGPSVGGPRDLRGPLTCARSIVASEDSMGPTEAV